MTTAGVKDLEGAQRAALKRKLDAVVEQACQVILGKERAVRLALACLMARGHLLIEDIPGVGKTTLGHVLAQSLGLTFQRIQFTSDLLPADILGVSIYERHTGAFKFHPGPIFAQLVLADEVNRATPKTQSALLESMEEHQVTLEGETRPLPRPFFVVATQNPSYQVGTFPLPESQLDRFLMRIELGYPDAAAERNLLRGRDRRELIGKLEPRVSVEELVRIQAMVPRVRVAPALLDYVQDLLGYTRETPDFEIGLSPRAGLALVRSAQAWTLLSGRGHVVPEDVQLVLPGVVGHRLRFAPERGGDGAASVAEHLIRLVPIP